jgi:hypothetical protein
MTPETISNDTVDDEPLMRALRCPISSLLISLAGLFGVSVTFLVGVFPITLSLQRGILLFVAIAVLGLLMRWKQEYVYRCCLAKWYLKSPENRLTVLLAALSGLFFASVWCIRHSIAEQRQQLTDTLNKREDLEIQKIMFDEALLPRKVSTDGMLVELYYSSDPRCFISLESVKDEDISFAQGRDQITMYYSQFNTKSPVYWKHFDSAKYSSNATRACAISETEVLNDDDTQSVNYDVWRFVREYDQSSKRHRWKIIQHSGGMQKNVARMVYDKIAATLDNSKKWDEGLEESRQAYEKVGSERGDEEKLQKMNPDRLAP